VWFGTHVDGVPREASTELLKSLRKPCTQPLRLAQRFPRWGYGRQALGWMPCRSWAESWISWRRMRTWWRLLRGRNTEYGGTPQLGSKTASTWRPGSRSWSRTQRTEICSAKMRSFCRMIIDGMNSGRVFSSNADCLFFGTSFPKDAPFHQLRWHSTAPYEPTAVPSNRLADIRRRSSRFVLAPQPPGSLSLSAGFRGVQQVSLAHDPDHPPLVIDNRNAADVVFEQGLSELWAGRHDGDDRRNHHVAPFHRFQLLRTQKFAKIGFLLLLPGFSGNQSVSLT